MTLINLLTRIHFADGVLEDALHSEIEANKKRRPLVVATEGPTANLEAARFFSGFPRRADPIVFKEVPHLPSESAVRKVAKLYKENDCDVLVAYGPNRVINLAKSARVAIAHDEPLIELSVSEGGSRRIAKTLPSLYAVPSVLGFSAAVSDFSRVTLDDGSQILLSARSMTPCIAICDPTLTLDASEEDTVTAAAGVVSRCVDSYLSPGYHPPAEGLALDALNRIWLNLDSALSHEDLPARREIMAAGLNSSFALQKGQCTVQALGNAVAMVSRSKPDPSVVSGVVLSHLVEFYEGTLKGRSEQIKRSLHIESDCTLGEGLRRMLAGWPFPKKLSELGVEVSALNEAAKIAAKDRAISNGPRNFDRSEIRQLLALAH
ncbi:MAG: iron-containing alcohol dehydrogenase [Arenibacterium sp.]